MGFFNFWKKKQPVQTPDPTPKPKSISESYRDSQKMCPHEAIPFDPVKYENAKIELNDALGTFNLTIVDKMREAVKARQTNTNDGFRFNIAVDYSISDDDLKRMPGYRELHRICADPAVDVKIWKFSMQNERTSIYLEIARPYEESSNKNCFKEKVKDDPVYSVKAAAAPLKKEVSLSQAFREKEKSRKKSQSFKEDPILRRKAQAMLNKRLAEINLGILESVKKLLEKPYENEAEESGNIILKTDICYPLSDKDLREVPNYRALHKIFADPAVDMMVFTAHTDDNKTHIYISMDTPYEVSPHKDCFKDKTPMIKFDR